MRDITADSSTVAYISAGEAKPPSIQQKRHLSNSYEYHNSSFIKRRVGSTEKRLSTDELESACFLDAHGTPFKKHEMSPGYSKRIIDETPQPSYVAAEPPQSPFYLPTTSSCNLEAAANVNENSSVRLSETCIEHKQEHLHTRNPELNYHSKVSNDNQLQRQHQITHSIHEDSANRYINKTIVGNPDQTNGEVDSNEHNDNCVGDDKNPHGNDEENQNCNDSGNTNNGNPGNDNNSSNNQNNSSSSSNNNNNNNNNNENNNENVQPVGASSKQTSQALVQKLQDIYRNIVKQEVELQERCSQLTTSQTTELKNLWVIYKVNAELINNYVAFITTALLPSQPEQDLLVGQEIVDIYRIERRLWVYGTITLLDVLKNFSNFMDPEVCCQFITHVFISISNMLGDMPPKYSTPWLERLGDLSRMAIALYPSGFIDWKLSAEHWYSQAMIYIYGHGKLYYHMSTVQQNTLEAFVNLGKSVFCQDTFIPSQQYMQLVIDNIYQRAFAERNGGNHRNSLIVEYLKHSEVMLLSSFLESPELQKVVSTFFHQKFGLLPKNTDFFNHREIFIQDGEKVKYFFRHAPAFAESHILQLVGFGDPKNPFALLFELPKFLKERKERKERRKSKTSSSSIAIETMPPQSPTEYLEHVDSPKFSYQFPTDTAIWEQALSYVNRTSLECSMTVLRKFLHGPLVSAVPHLLPWAYFLLAVALRIRELPNQELKIFWVSLMRRILPWNSIVNFLNMLIAFSLDNNWKTTPIDALCEQFDAVDLSTLIEHFSNNEDLPEVWKCWGTLWFDVIADKSEPKDDGMQSTGVKDHLFLDFPIDGICFDEEDESGVKFWKRTCRLIFLFKGIAREFEYGLALAPTAVPTRRIVSPDHPLQRFSFKFDANANAFGGNAFVNTHIPLSEEISQANMDVNALPGTSMLEGESLFQFEGYRQLYPDYSCFNKNGDMITCSLYTSGPLEKGAIQGGDDFNASAQSGRDGAANADTTAAAGSLEKLEREWLDTCMNPEFIKQTFENKFPYGDLSCYCDSGVSYFVLDATSWLRHFAHVYKLATNGVLKFAICLTTFQELRFLRKSKDESVVEAATRAVITVRQLYTEKRLLPLRFTGNVATHLEEHLEFEEQITWRSHVDEFVIEAVFKAQAKFENLNTQAREAGRECIASSEEHPFHFVALVTDDTNMRLKAHAQQIQTFSSRFMFAVCNQIGVAHHACTN
ncbi:LAFE_0F00760g1_1 [Lachancea fermentati]|uniref:LAFE_0F00760g1_1 n=1 Tax=Lachancea fermentati TaxID=4955 RepID=A0A1G4ME28_LACFM|nr:LAFE_0F00760g1_1 [Lachancea fermentati]